MAIQNFKNKIKRKIKTFFWLRDVRRRAKHISESCGNVCFCPECRNPLNDGLCKENTVKDRYDYTCGWCRRKSTFDFSIAPVPILIDEKKDNISDKNKET